jgi:DNA modification methylase
MEIQEIKTELLIPYAFNNRTHPAQQVERIANSIKEFGFTQPIVADSDNIVVAGHGRLEAAKRLGLKTVPVVRVGALTSTQIKAYRILDNKLQNDSDWELKNLELELGGLEEAGFDLKGWGLDQLKGLLQVDIEIVEDAGPGESPSEESCLIKSGDLIELNGHRLLCGDSREADNFELVLEGRKPSLIFTDPPYGVAIGKKNRMLNSFQKAGRNLTDIEDDALSPEDLKKALLPAFQNIRSFMAEDCTVFVTAPQGGELGMMMMMMQEADLRVRHVLIWKKNAPTFSMGRLDYDYQHEPILLTWGKRHKRPMLGKHRTSVWEVDKPRESKEHPTMKPIELVVNALLNNSDAGDVVFDAYSGSGTTLIAAEQTGRAFCGIELMPKYCQVIARRYGRFLESQNRPFDCKINGEAVALSEL